jgi:hypothetical protein
MKPRNKSERDALILAIWHASDQRSVTAVAEEAVVHWDVAARVLREAGITLPTHCRSLPDSPERDEMTRQMRLERVSWRQIAIQVYGNRNAEGRIKRRQQMLGESVTNLNCQVAAAVPPSRRMFGLSPLPAGHPWAVAVLRDAGVWVGEVP